MHISRRPWGSPWQRKIPLIGTPRALSPWRQRSATAQPSPRSRGKIRGRGRNCGKTASKAAEGLSRGLQELWCHDHRAGGSRSKNHHFGEISPLRTHHHGETCRPAVARERSLRESFPPPHGPQTPCFPAENTPLEDLTKSSSQVARGSLSPSVHSQGLHGPGGFSPRGSTVGQQHRPPASFPRPIPAFTNETRHEIAETRDWRSASTNRGAAAVADAGPGGAAAIALAAVPTGSRLRRSPAPASTPARPAVACQRQSAPQELP